MRGSMEQRWVRIGVLTLGLASLGCAPRERAPVQENEGIASDLVATMEVEPGGDAVALTLHLTNATAAPIELSFSSGQRYDFAVSRLDGEVLWRWSSYQSFMQVVGTQTLAAGSSLRYREQWPSGGMRGEFVATGEVTATNRRIIQSARFELAGNE